MLRLASPAIIVVALVSVLSGTAPAQGAVWIVDDTPGPDVDFSELQPAVDAASDLDLIVVRAGGYNAPVRIDGKGLTLVAEEGAILAPPLLFSGNRVIEVINLPVSKSVVLRGLDTAPLFGGSVDVPGIRLENNAGPVLIEDMNISTPLGAGIFVQNCAAVTVSRCIATGGTRVDAFAGVYLTHAGVFARDSDVYLYDTTAQGSSGGNATPGFAFPPTPTIVPGQGAPGVQLQGGTLLATGCTFLGGNSGADAPGLCFAGEDGGAGLQISDFTTAPVARLLDTTAVGGAGGVGTGMGCAQPDGAAGVAELVLGGTLEHLPGTARSFDWDTPVVGGAPFDLTFTGEPGDLAILLITVGPGPDDYLEGFGAALLIDPVYLVAVIDVLPASGVLAQTLTAVEPGLEHFRLSAQAAFISPTAQFFLSGPSTLTILRPEEE